MGRRRSRKQIRPRLKGKADQCPLLGGSQITEGWVEIFYDPSNSLSVGRSIEGSSNDLQLSIVNGNVNTKKLESSTSKTLMPDEEGGGFPLSGMYEMTNIGGFRDAKMLPAKLAMRLRDAIVPTLKSSAKFECGCITDDYEFKRRDPQKFGKLINELNTFKEPIDLSNIKNLISRQIKEVYNQINTEKKALQNLRKELTSANVNYIKIKEENHNKIKEIEDKKRNLRNKHKEDLRTITNIKEKKALKSTQKNEISIMIKQIKELKSEINDASTDLVLINADFHKKNNRTGTFETIDGKKYEIKESKEDIENNIKSKINDLSEKIHSYQRFDGDFEAIIDYVNFPKDSDGKPIIKENSDWFNQLNKYIQITSPRNREGVSKNVLKSINRNYTYVPKKWVEKAYPICVTDSAIKFPTICKLNSDYEWLTESQWKIEKENLMKSYGSIDMNNFIKKDKDARLACTPLSDTINFNQDRIDIEVTKSLNQDIIPFAFANRVVFLPSNQVEMDSLGNVTEKFLEKNSFNAIDWKDIVVTKKNHIKSVFDKEIYMVKQIDTKTGKEIIPKGYTKIKSGEDLRKSMKKMGDVNLNASADTICKIKDNVESLWDIEIDGVSYKKGDMIPYEIALKANETPQLERFQFFGYIDTKDIIDSPIKVGHQCKGTWQGTPKWNDALVAKDALIKGSTLKTKTKTGKFANVQFVPLPSEDKIENEFLSSESISDPSILPEVMKLHSKAESIKENFISLKANDYSNKAIEWEIKKAKHEASKRESAIKRSKARAESKAIEKSKKKIDASLEKIHKKVVSLIDNEGSFVINTPINMNATFDIDKKLGCFSIKKEFLIDSENDIKKSVGSCYSDANIRKIVDRMELDKDSGLHCYPRSWSNMHTDSSIDDDKYKGISSLNSAWNFVDNTKVWDKKIFSRKHPNAIKEFHAIQNTHKLCINNDNLEKVEEFLNNMIVEPTKVEPTKVEPTKVEPTKVEPTKVEPTKVENSIVTAKLSQRKVDIQGEETINICLTLDKKYIKDKTSMCYDKNQAKKLLTTLSYNKSKKKYCSSNSWKNITINILQGQSDNLTKMENIIEINNICVPKQSISSLRSFVN